MESVEYVEEMENLVSEIGMDAVQRQVSYEIIEYGDELSNSDNKARFDKFIAGSNEEWVFLLRMELTFIRNLTYQVHM